MFAAFFLSGVVAAGILLGGRYHNPFPNGSWSDYAPEFVEVLAQTGLAIAVVLLLSARRGVTPRTLGLTLPHRDDGHFAAGQATRILAWAIFAQVLGGVINAVLQTGHLPTSQPNAAELIFAMAASIQAGVVEELVVLAFVVVTLRQAGRPLWEITVVALVLRGSYHIYYGPGVVGILVWAALFYWIYLRTGNLILLMISHAGWDAVAFLSQRWGAVAGVGVLVAIAIWIAAPITWFSVITPAPTTTKTMTVASASTEVRVSYQLFQTSSMRRPLSKARSALRKSQCVEMTCLYEQKCNATFRRARFDRAATWLGCTGSEAAIVYRAEVDGSRRAAS